MIARVERETEISPEIIIGEDFRVPAIIGHGSGRDFGSYNLHLPKGWRKAIPELKKTVHKHEKLFFELIRAHPVASAGQVRFDNGTGVLLEATALSGITRVSRIRLSCNDFDRERGVYKMEEVYDARVAIALQRVVVANLSVIYSAVGEARLPYIGGTDRGYFSVDLGVPRTILNSPEPVTNEYYRQNFVVEASNIAGRFGVSLYGNQLSFDRKGILESVSLNEGLGGGCSYYRPSSDSPFPGEFISHNVDLPEQALALHAIVASHINWLLGKNGK